MAADEEELPNDEEELSIDDEEAISASEDEVTLLVIIMSCYND